MGKGTRFVGLDTDKQYIDVAVAEPLPGGEVRDHGRIPNTVEALDRLLERLCRGGWELVVCYEAGPCGYAISRQLAGRPGVTCHMVAPSMTPRRPGDKVKTNRRDARMLARMLRAEALTSVWVPDETHEAMRDLVRARGAAVEALVRCRQHVSSFLLRQRIGYPGKPWTKKHRAWLGRLEFDHAAHRLMLGDALSALDAAIARRDRLTQHIEELVPSWSLAWLVEATKALRGYRSINAIVLVAEIGDPRRFANARQLMGFVGMGVAEHSTGDSVRRQGLTRTGNKRARKTVIEAAWTHARPTRGANQRALGQSPAVCAVATKASHRLGRRYRQLMARGKRATVAIAAVARESLGFFWAIAHAAAPDAARPTAAT